MLKIARLPVLTRSALADVFVCLQPLAAVPASRLQLRPPGAAGSALETEGVPK